MDSFVSLVRFELFRRVKLFGIRVKSQEGLFRIRVYFAAVVCSAGGGNIGAFGFPLPFLSLWVFANTTAESLLEGACEASVRPDA